MKSIKRKIGISVLIVIAISIIALLVNIQLTIYKYEREMRDYLVNTKNYKDEEILSIKCEFSKLPQYPVYVTFKDEPNVTYVYSRGGYGLWYQFPPQPQPSYSNYKHLEKN